MSIYLSVKDRENKIKEKNRKKVSQSNPSRLSFSLLLKHKNSLSLFAKINILVYSSSHNNKKNRKCEN